MGKWNLGRFRLIAFIEGLSYLVLLLIAMPLKYLADFPLAVTIVGGLHGGLFILYFVLLVPVWIERKWPIGKLAGATLASLVPLGTFVFDCWLKKTEPDLRNKSGSSDLEISPSQPSV